MPNPTRLAPGYVTEAEFDLRVQAAEMTHPKTI